MEEKKKTIIILLTPVGLAMAFLWFNAVFNSLRDLALHSQEVGTEMWIRTMLTLISAGAFAYVGYKMFKLIKKRGESKKKKRRHR